MPPCPSDIAQYGIDHNIISTDKLQNRITNEPSTSESRIMREKNIKKMSKQFSTFEIGKPLTPLLQLLTVIPKYSFHLLPESIQKKLEEHSGEIDKWFPENIEEDPNNCPVKYRWIPLVPILDRDELKLLWNITDLSTESNLLTKKQISNTLLYTRQKSLVQSASQLTYDWETFKDTLCKNKLFGRIKVINENLTEIQPDDVLKCIYMSENNKGVFPPFSQVPDSTLLTAFGESGAIKEKFDGDLVYYFIIIVYLEITSIIIRKYSYYISICILYYIFNLKIE